MLSRRLPVLCRFCRDPGLSRVRQHPAAAGPNWLGYNGFRSGDLSPPDGLAVSAPAPWFASWNQITACLPPRQECVVDPADELVILPPFCTAPG